MSESRLHRRLTAILAADVVGYSRLVREDEEATLALVASDFGDVVVPQIENYGGRVFKTLGDGLLAEFPSVVDAVRCATDVQRAIRTRNRKRAEGRRIELRIGINLGDVVYDDDDLKGDGVNVAARLESLAEPGGICISRTARDQVRDRSDIALEDMGEVEVKNIARPVHIFRVLTGSETTPAAIVRLRRRVNVKTALVFATVLLAAITGGILLFDRWTEPIDRPKSSLSAQTSIAILPFQNLSGDVEQDYFADGITNDLITDLSKFHNLFVIASNSVFVYKGKPVDIQQVGQDLGVSYVLEGSVQPGGDRMRINAQLIDAATGRHLWADRYEEELVDIFELQDTIVTRVVRSLSVQLSDFEEERSFSKQTRNLQAYDYFLQGRALLKKSLRRENFQARDLFRQAIELDQDYASAYAGVGWTYMNALLYGWTGQPQNALEQAHKFAKLALSISEGNADGHKLLARIYLTRRQYDLALVESERVVVNNPNDAEGHIEQGYVLFWMGRVDGAILALETALRFDPNMGPEAYWYFAAAHYLKGDYPKAIAITERNLERRSDFSLDYLILAAAYAQTEKPARARRAADHVRRLDPFFDVEKFAPMFASRADAERFIDGLRKAGL